MIISFPCDEGSMRAVICEGVQKASIAIAQEHKSECTNMHNRDIKHSSTAITALKRCEKEIIAKVAEQKQTLNLQNQMLDSMPQEKAQSLPAAGHTHILKVDRKVASLL